MTLYRFSTFRYNCDTRELSCDKEGEKDSHYLRKKVADVLTYLLENRDRVVSKDELLQAVWEQGDYRESSLLQSIKTLRKLLGDSAQTPQFIRTVYLKGYEWIYDSVTIDTEPEVVETVEVVPLYKGYFKQVVIAASIAFVLLALTAVYYSTDEEPLAAQGLGGVAVLPFINDTGDSQLQWLELGYSDMFSQGLRKAVSYQVVPTYHVQGAMAQQQLDRRLSDSEQITRLIESMQVRYALVATINKDGKALRFNYRIHDRNGVFAGASIRFPNLPSSLPSLVSQVATQLGNTAYANQPVAMLISTNPEAQQAYANGVQALQGKGARLAKHYFEAALLNDEHSPAIIEKLAYTLYLMGQWQQSESYYRDLLSKPALVEDPYLATGVFNGLANLLLQQNQLEESEELLNRGLLLADEQLMRYRRAQLLRTLAKLSQIQKRLPQRHQLLAEADKLSQPFESLQNEADALYYLGSPSNVGMEVDPDINMRGNMAKLDLALRHYRQLNNQTGIGRALLAVGQNYYFPLEKRHDALREATDIFRQSGNRFDLIDTLVYTGFFYIQYHHGKQAAKVLASALALNQVSVDIHRAKLIQFMLAFANLDQGIDRGAGSNPLFLQAAVRGFSHTINDFEHTPHSSLNSDSEFLMGWAYAELDQPLKAMALFEKTLAVYRQLNYPASSLYALTSLMEEHLKLGDWDKVIELAETEDGQSYLTGLYKARAQYQLAQFTQARQTLLRVKRTQADLWTGQDDQRLIIYANSADSGQKASLPQIISSHLNYCETIRGDDDFKGLFKPQ